MPSIKAKNLKGKSKGGKNSWVHNDFVRGTIRKGTYFLRYREYDMGLVKEFRCSTSTKDPVEANRIYDDFAKNPELFIKNVQEKRALKKGT